MHESALEKVAGSPRGRMVPRMRDSISTARNNFTVIVEGERVSAVYTTGFHVRAE